MSETFDDDDPDCGKVVWPIVDGVQVEWDDIAATLFDISGCKLELTDSDETGQNLYTGVVAIGLYNEHEGYRKGSLPYYFWLPLKTAMENMLAEHPEDEDDSYDPEEDWLRQVIRLRALLTDLLAVYNKWEAEG